MASSSLVLVDVLSIVVYASKVLAGVKVRVVACVSCILLSGV